MNRRHIERAIALSALGSENLVAEGLAIVAALRMAAMGYLPEGEKLDVRLPDGRKLAIPLGAGPRGEWRSRAREVYPLGIVMLQRVARSPFYPTYTSREIGGILAERYGVEVLVDVVYGIERARTTLLRRLEKNTRWV